MRNASPVAQRLRPVTPEGIYASAHGFTCGSRDRDAAVLDCIRGATWRSIAARESTHHDIHSDARSVDHHTWPDDDDAWSICDVTRSIDLARSVDHDTWPVDHHTWPNDDAWSDDDDAWPDDDHAWSICDVARSVHRGPARVAELEDPAPGPEGTDDRPPRQAGWFVDDDGFDNDGLDNDGLDNDDRDRQHWSNEPRPGDTQAASIGECNGGSRPRADSGVEFSHGVDVDFHNTDIHVDSDGDDVVDGQEQGPPMVGRGLTAGAIVAVAVATPALAQGNSQGHKKAAPAPPSRNDLVAPSMTTARSGAASPIAWVDDATVLDSGGVAIAISMLRWSGSGLSEVNAPVVDIALGLTPRVQFSASVPRVVGSADPGGAAGGLGTSYFSAKIGVFNSKKQRAKLAVSPTLEVLSPGVVGSLASGEHRVQVGFPVSAEIDRGPVRLDCATGYFTPRPG